MFDKNTFENAFNKSLDEIANSEKITKGILRDLSRTILEAWHATGNVMYANKLIRVLTPVNKKTCVLFFKHFSGFSFDDVEGQFTHKSKKRYDKAHAECMEKLADPNFNIWSWAERHIQIEQKPFDLNGVQKYMTKAIQNAEAAGISQREVLRAVFKAGMKPETILEIMDELGFDVDVVE